MFSAWWEAFSLNALVLLLAVALDRLLPEPPAAIHPVVWMGRAVSAMERRAPEGRSPAFLYGCVVVVLVVGVSTAVAWLVTGALMAVGPVAYVVGGALMFRSSFTVRGLKSAADETRVELIDGRLEEARTSLRSLVSRDASALKPPLVAAAAIESVAENTTDSYIAPWLAFAVLGVPGPVAYRAVNTLDSMLGFRGEFEYLGKGAARLDDIVNLVPARMSAILLLAGGAMAGYSAGRGWRVMLRDRTRTASPNAGWTMSAMAGLLGARLEKTGHYCLGEGLREPVAEDIGAALRIAGRAAAFGVVMTLCVLAVRHAILG